MLYITALLFPAIIIPVGIFTLISVVRYVREIAIENKRIGK